MDDVEYKIGLLVKCQITPELQRMGIVKKIIINQKKCKVMYLNLQYEDDGTVRKNWKTKIIRFNKMVVVTDEFISNLNIKSDQQHMTKCQQALVKRKFELYFR